MPEIKNTPQAVHKYLAQKGISINTYQHIIITDSLYRPHKLVDLLEGYGEFLNNKKI